METIQINRSLLKLGYYPIAKGEIFTDFVKYDKNGVTTIRVFADGVVNVWRGSPIELPGMDDRVITEEQIEAALGN